MARPGCHELHGGVGEKGSGQARGAMRCKVCGRPRVPRVTKCGGSDGQGSCSCRGLHSHRCLPHLPLCLTSPFPSPTAKAAMNLDSVVQRLQAFFQRNPTPSGADLLVDGDGGSAPQGRLDSTAQQQVRGQGGRRQVGKGGGRAGGTREGRGCMNEGNLFFSCSFPCSPPFL